MVECLPFKEKVVGSSPIVFKKKFFCVVPKNANLKIILYYNIYSVIN